LLEEWQRNIVHLREVPSLSAVDRYPARWIARYLMEPSDVRPRLLASMPRLSISAAQAWDIAAYLGQGSEAHEDVASTALGDLPADADPKRGAALFSTNGCGACHLFTGVDGASELASATSAAPELRPAVALAPDLAFARERLTTEQIAALLDVPRAYKRDALMPSFLLDADDRRDIAAFIVAAPLSTAVAPTPPEPLPPLDRRVTYDEVSARVFRKTCWHCHSEPGYGLGDGGPGNTGGFGFAGRGLSLAEYSTVAAGVLDDDGRRRSVFELIEDAPASYRVTAPHDERDGGGPWPANRRAPRLVAVLRARQDEQAGRARSTIRGMPLGLPALSAEDIQLVESWVAQGRPQ
jgi:cytochrome c